MKEQDKVSAAMGNLTPEGVLSLAGNTVVVALRNQSLWPINGEDGSGAPVAPARGSTYRRRPLFMSPDGTYFARVSPDLGGTYSSLIGLGEVERHDVRSNAIERWRIHKAAAAAPMLFDKWVVGTNDLSARCYSQPLSQRKKET